MSISPPTPLSDSGDADPSRLALPTPRTASSDNAPETAGYDAGPGADVDAARDDRGLAVTFEVSSEPVKAAAPARTQDNPPAPMRRRKVKVGIALGSAVVAGLVYATSAYGHSSDPDPDPDPTGPSACEITVTGSHNNITSQACAPDQDPSDDRLVDPDGAGDEELRKQSAAAADISAASLSGPYPFAVVDAGAEGLIVRDSPYADGRQIGSLADHRRALVACRRSSGFNPVPFLTDSSTWYRIHWASTAPSSEWGRSEFADPAQGWIFSHYAIPLVTDDEVPAC